MFVEERVGQASKQFCASSSMTVCEILSLDMQRVLEFGFEAASAVITGNIKDSDRAWRVIVGLRRSDRARRNSLSKFLV